MRALAYLLSPLFFSSLLIGRSFATTTTTTTPTPAPDPANTAVPHIYETPDGLWAVEDAPTLEKRTPPAGVYVCNQKWWQGTCTWNKLTDMACMGFPWDAGSSVGPPQGWQCKFYYKADCQGPDQTDGRLTFPGTDNLGQLYNNQLKPMSYKCRMCPDGCPGNLAPLFEEAGTKVGYKDDKGRCRYWDGGAVKTYSSC